MIPQPAATVPKGGAVPAVWLLRDSEPLPPWVEPEDCLSLAERGRSESIRHPQARLQFLRGRRVLRSALGHALGIPARAVPIRLSPDGKPYLDPADGCPAIDFNQSHTTGYALFGISRDPIGVDIESADPKRDLDGLVRRFFAPEEQTEYFALEANLRPAAFLRGWTCKEALLKAIGSGVRDLQNCAVRMDPRLPPAVRRAPGDADWKLAAGEIEPGIAWAVAGRTAKSN